MARKVADNSSPIPSPSVSRYWKAVTIKSCSEMDTAVPIAGTSTNPSSKETGGDRARVSREKQAKSRASHELLVGTRSARSMTVELPGAVVIAPSLRSPRSE